MAAEACYFFFDKKVTKIKSPPYASLPHGAFILQSEAAPRAV